MNVLVERMGAMAAVIIDHSAVRSAIDCATETVQARALSVFYADLAASAVVLCSARTHLCRARLQVLRNQP